MHSCIHITANTIHQILRILSFNQHLSTSHQSPPIVPLPPMAPVYIPNCTERERFSPITVAKRQVPWTPALTPNQAEIKFKKASVFHGDLWKAGSKICPGKTPLLTAWLRPSELLNFFVEFLAPERHVPYYTTSIEIYTAENKHVPLEKGPVFQPSIFWGYVNFGVVQNVFWWQMSPFKLNCFGNNLTNADIYYMTFFPAFDHKKLPPTLPSDPCSEASESTPTRSHINISTRRYQEKNDHRKGTRPGSRIGQVIGENYSHAQLLFGLSKSDSFKAKGRMLWIFVATILFQICLDDDFSLAWYLHAI